MVLLSVNLIHVHTIYMIILAFNRKENLSVNDVQQSLYVI